MPSDANKSIEGSSYNVHLFPTKHCGNTVALCKNETEREAMSSYRISSLGNLAKRLENHRPRCHVVFFSSSVVSRSLRHGGGRGRKAGRGGTKKRKKKKKQNSMIGFPCRDREKRCQIGAEHGAVCAM